MSEPHDLRDLVGEDAGAEELETLRAVDALLRTVPPPPPEIPASLTRAVLEPRVIRFSTRRRAAVAIALAAALAALSFAVGRWTDDGSFDTQAAVVMESTAEAPGAAAVIRLGKKDASGNWTIELEAAGLPKLPRGDSYVLWLAKNGKYAATCGYFQLRDHAATVQMNGAYRLTDYDTWVITAHSSRDPDAPTPWLLKAPIRA
jgi:hypothetical protein